MHPPPTATSDTPRIVGAGVDSLYLSHRLKPLWAAMRELEQAKARAARSRRAARDPRTGEELEETEAAHIELGGRTWDVMAYGSGEGPYLLRSDDAHLAVNPDARNGAPVLTAKVLSSALWRDGPAPLVALVDRVAEDLGHLERDEDRYVRRVDVAVDFQGWVPQTSDFDLFCCPGAPTKQLHPNDEPVDELLEHPRMWARWRLSGFRFGQSSVVVRLYDKRAEIGVSGKEWFRAIWNRWEDFDEEGNARPFDPAGPVWRLEVQAPRVWLKDLRTDGGEKIESVEETLAHLGDIWRTVLTDKVRLTNGDASRLTRSSVRPQWLALAETIHIDGACEGGRVTRLEQDRMSAESLKPKIRGYLAKFGALLGIRTLEDVTVEAAQSIAELCASRGEPFEELVDEKVRRRHEAAAALVAAEQRAQKTRQERARRVAELERAAHAER